MRLVVGVLLLAAFAMAAVTAVDESAADALVDADAMAEADTQVDTDVLADADEDFADDSDDADADADDEAEEESDDAAEEEDDSDVEDTLAEWRTEHERDAQREALDAQDAAREGADIEEAELLEFVPAGQADARCPRAEPCPACPAVAAVKADKETLLAAKAYVHEFGDSDAVADMTVRDTVRPAFLAGVKFADKAVRLQLREKRLNWQHSVDLLDTHRHYKPVPKGCPPLPSKLGCQCKPYLRLSHLPETTRKSFDYAREHRDGDESWNWSMNEAVHDAFMAGVEYNDHERAIRAANNEIKPAGATRKEKMANLQKQLDAVVKRENAQRVPKDK